MSGKLYVQYGCGWSAPGGWHNVDASPTLWFERLPVLGRLYTRNAHRFPENVVHGDIVKGLPVPPDSCRGVYCSHVLEHLALADFRTALRNTHRMLCAGGVFRLVLPDLELLARCYLDDPSADAALTFMRESGLGHDRRIRGFRGLVVEWLGNARHLWLWDFKSIASELGASGFVDIRRAQFGDSCDPTFHAVEDKDRWEGCLGVECRKPEGRSVESAPAAAPRAVARQ